jgi:hypothetical protein
MMEARDPSVERRRAALFALMADLRRGADAGEGRDELGYTLVDRLIDAMGDADGYNAGLAAGALRTIAQYRRGDASTAAVALAGALSHPRHQELRKEAGEALVELAENGGALPVAALPSLEEATRAAMKHTRQLATFALAADAVARADRIALEALVRAHPRPDVRQRAASYVVRGAEWRDASFSVPLWTEDLRAVDRPTRVRAVRTLQAIFSGPRNGGVVSSGRSEAARSALVALDEAGATLDDIEESASARAWAEQVSGQASRWREIGPRVAALEEGGSAGPEALDAAARASREVREAMVTCALDRGSWRALTALLDHPDAGVRADVLAELSWASLRRMVAFTPLVPALARRLSDEVPELRAAALGVLHNLAHAGSALDRTRLDAATEALAALAAGDGPEAEQARQVGDLARQLGGL